MRSRHAFAFAHTERITSWTVIRYIHYEKWWGGGWRTLLIPVWGCGSEVKKNGSFENHERGDKTACSLHLHRMVAVHSQRAHCSIRYMKQNILSPVVIGLRASTTNTHIIISTIGQIRRMLNLSFIELWPNDLEVREGSYGRLKCSI